VGVAHQAPRGVCDERRRQRGAARTGAQCAARPRLPGDAGRRRAPAQARRLLGSEATKRTGAPPPLARDAAVRTLQVIASLLCCTASQCLLSIHRARQPSGVCNCQCTTVQIRSAVDPSFPAYLHDIANALAAAPAPDADDRAKFDALSFAIDDPHTSEVDDAVRVERLPAGGWKVWVHVADPSALVKAGGPLDLEASQRCGAWRFDLQLHACAGRRCHLLHCSNSMYCVSAFDCQGQRRGLLAVHDQCCRCHRILRLSRADHSSKRPHLPDVRAAVQVPHDLLPARKSAHVPDRPCGGRLLARPARRVPLAHLHRHRVHRR
jgi:RNB domain